MNTLNIDTVLLRMCRTFSLFCTPDAVRISRVRLHLNIFNQMMHGRLIISRVEYIIADTGLQIKTDDVGLHVTIRMIFGFIDRFLSDLDIMKPLLSDPYLGGHG
jgi:hypothetical protein